MTVAIHQPNYLPWLGYFYKLYLSDVFVFHDVVAFSATAYTKRCKIRRDKHSGVSRWLSVPVKYPGTQMAISDVRISMASDWAGQHLRKIANTYRAAPHYNTYIEWLANALEIAAKMEHLAECNIFLIREFADLLGIGKAFRQSSELDVTGKASELNLSIVQALGGTRYLAGAGSRQYENEESFAKHDIALIRHDLYAWLDAHPYEQGTGTFTNGLSFVDALMHVGTEGILEIFSSYRHVI